MNSLVHPLISDPAKPISGSLTAQYLVFPERGISLIKNVAYFATFAESICMLNMKIQLGDG